MKRILGSIRFWKFFAFGLVVVLVGGLLVGSSSQVTTSLLYTLA